MRVTDEMVEVAARALYDRLLDPSDEDEVAFGTSGFSHWCRRQVRTALEAVESADEIDRLTARVAELEGAGRDIMPYLRWTISDESPGHHPTMPSAIAAFREILEPKP